MRIINAFIVFIFLLLRSHAYSTDYPPPACVIYDNLTLTICPPDPLPEPPIVLTGYHIYVDDVFLDNIPVSPPYDNVVYFFDEPQLIPGPAYFCAKAVYSEVISEPICDADTVFYGFELPFYEDWSSGSFETNAWTVDGSNWEIAGDAGNPSPVAVFNGQPVLTSYYRELASYYFRADNTYADALYIMYDLKLDDINSTGQEQLRMEVWSWESNTWTHWTPHYNNGTTGWEHFEQEICQLACGKVSKIRFMAHGSNSGNIGRWMIDNIRIVAECKSPEDLITEEIYPAGRRLHWTGFIGDPYFIHFDDGINHSSIGTGSPAEFEVAARWTPDLLTDYADSSIHMIGIVPSEPQAAYTLRIWQGENAEELVHEQVVTGLEFEEWNLITLDSLVPIDITRDLWAGYKIITPTGYPAGCDDGPVIDGYGNMINWGGWQTLLQINPELDYNWNIQVYLTSSTKFFDHINIYRQENSTGEFEWIDSTNHPYQYIDHDAFPTVHYCYKLTAAYHNDTDTCESPFSNEACDNIIPGTEEIPFADSRLSIYPNPASEYISVISDQVIDEVVVYNIVGDQIFRASNAGKETIIPVTGLPSGLYIIQIRSKAGLSTKKILVLH